MTLHLGIDIGVLGAIAIVDQSGALVEIHDMPVLHDGPKGRRTVNAPLLTSIIFKSHADHAFVEYVSARPGEGAVGAFAFGRSRGVIEGVLAAAGVPCSFLTPSCWKRTVGLTVRSDPPLAQQCQSFRAGKRRRPRRSRAYRRRWTFTERRKSMTAHVLVCGQLLLVAVRTPPPRAGRGSWNR